MFLKNVGPVELSIVLGIVLLLFGAGRITLLGRELGSAIRGFRKALHDEATQPDGQTG